MSAVIKAIKNVLSSVWDAFTDVVKAVWDAVVEPVLEEIFSWFGIEDETIVNVQRISSRVYGTNTTDVYQAGVSRAVMNKIRTNTDFFPNFMQQIFRVKGQLRSYFRFGQLELFFNGLPEMVIQGTFINFDDVQIALDETFGSTHTVLSAVSRNPTEFQFYFFELKETHNYKAWLNTLTFTDTLYGAEREGWFVTNIELNAGPNTYTITVSRSMETAEFFIYGPDQITEGETATYTIRSNRVVPNNEQITIGFTYAGTAVDGVDYTQVASVIMPENTDEVTVDLVTLDTANANRTMAITIATLDNTGGVFEHVNINALDTVTTVITDDDSLLLTMGDQLVVESDITITIQVKLGAAAPSGAFTVDYNFTDLGGITGGVDYDNTPGTLSFAGNADEIQEIEVDIFADVADDDLEQFEVFLENSSDVDGIDISAVAKITILDKTGDPSPGTTLIFDSFLRDPAFVKEDSLIVTYSDDSEPTEQFHFWVQPHSDPTYDLAATHSTIDDLEMMPMAIIRKEKTQWDVLHAPGSPEFLTTRMLFARIGLDINEFLFATGSNPDISQIDDTYLNFSVGPNDVNPVVSKILWLQWEQILITSGLQSNVDSLSATIKEGDIENAIVWSGHSIEFARPGSVTDVGAYTHIVAGNTLTMQFQKIAGFYDEIIMTNLNGMTSINYQTFHEVALNTLDDDNFTVPVSWKIFNEVPAREQMEVFQFLCRCDMNAVVITHLEWYETEAFFELFEFVLVIVLIVVTVLSFGTALQGATSIYAGFLAIVDVLVTSWAIGELIIFIAEASGSAFLAAVVAVYLAIKFGDTKFLEELGEMVLADQLTAIVTNFADDFLVAYLELDALETVAEIEALQLTIKEETERLEELAAHRPDTSALTDNFNFIPAVQSPDSSTFAAIQSQYDYDSLYSYDSIISRYHEQQLQIGVT